jgi:hypothetical protein
VPPTWNEASMIEELKTKVENLRERHEALSRYL